MKIKLMHELLRKYNGFFKKYRNVILFNKNLIISGIAAFFTGAIFTQLYAQQEGNNLLNAVVTLSVEYGIYIPLFAILFYRDNKHRYLDPVTGKNDLKKVRSDLKKLFAVFSISEIIYSVSKIYIHYYFLEQTAEPYKASMAASLAAWAIFLISINTSVKAVKLFRK
jgi:hypothetical protein